MNELDYLKALEDDYDNFEDKIDETTEKLKNFIDLSSGLNQISNFLTINNDSVDNGEFYHKRDLLYDYSKFMENNFYNAISDESDRINDEINEYIRVHGN